MGKGLSTFVVVVFIRRGLIFGSQEIFFVAQEFGLGKSNLRLIERQEEYRNFFNKIS